MDIGQAHFLEGPLRIALSMEDVLLSQTVTHVTFTSDLKAKILRT